MRHYSVSCCLVTATLLNLSILAQKTEYNLSSTATYFARGYASTMNENEHRLTVLNDSLLMEKVCDGGPMIIFKSSSIPSNNACLPSQSRYNLSCSCLKGFAHHEVWDFHLRAPDATPVSPFPTSITEGTVLQVQSVMLLDVPPTLRTLKIQGASSTLVPVHLEKASTGDDRVAIVRSQDESALTRVDLVNLDLDNVAIDPGFVPTTVSNLSLINCNLTRLSQPFLESFTHLASLNLAGNQLSSIYPRLPELSTDAFNAMAEIILANNSFTTFPIHLLTFPNLHTLDLRNNRISNLTLPSDAFATLTQLSDFQFHPQQDHHHQLQNDCPHGVSQTLHGVTFCVVPSTRHHQSSIPDLIVAHGSSDDNKSWTILLLLAAFGGCLVGFLLFCSATTFLRDRQQQKQEKDAPLSSLLVDDVPSPDNNQDVEPSAAYRSLHPTFHAGILTNPLIMSYRLKYQDVRIGKCISKGGFGLVYQGMYKHRRVAIKKIMREKCEKLSQIRMFLREITLMGHLKHERIVEFIGVAWDSLRNLCAVTEYMERGDLRDVLHALKYPDHTNHNNNNGDDEESGLTWNGLKLNIALHIAEGLEYMHSLTPKVIHRDLKSKNVLLNAAYEAKLSDFGVSRERQNMGHLKAGQGKFMTPGVGTSFWIAPEVLLGKDYDERADIFSFGVVLSELDTDDYPYWNSGNIPGQGDPTERRTQEQKILEQVALGALRPTFYNDCPPGVLALAALCLEGRPEHRPSAAQVVLTLRELMSKTGVHDDLHAEPEPDDLVTAGFLLND